LQEREHDSLIVWPSYNKSFGACCATGHSGTIVRVGSDAGCRTSTMNREAVHAAVPGCTRVAIIALLGTALMAALPARAADRALIEAAKKEGKVVWYTTLIVNQAIRPLQQAFEQKYPGVRLEYSRADDSPTALKILTEARAGGVQADIFDGLYNMMALRRAGLLAPYRPPNVDQYPQALRDPDGYWIAILIYVFSPGVNTNLVLSSEAPRSLRDLLDPRWRGKMAWNPNSIAGAPGFVGNVLMSMGEERGLNYLRALSQQQIVNVEASSRAILDQVIAGEYPIGLMMFNHHTVISARKGGPTTWLKLEPVPVAPDGIALLKDAPHPNAAKLLMEFLTSEDGQQVLRQADYLPALSSVPALSPGLRPEDGGFQATYLSPPAVDREMPHWSQVVSDLFR
jgi:ABC-type Fe3+ transport system substrate-binding protein